MQYLKRITSAPSREHLNADDLKTLEKHFDANRYELNIDGETVEWGLIDEVEVARAARSKSPAGWFVKNVIFQGERYHVGIYFGKEELVLPNLSEQAARYVVAIIAFYANRDIRYKGTESIAETFEG